jgi:hypothetical protein
LARSNTWTLSIQSVFNSSTRGIRNSSILLMLMFSFPNIINETNMKNCFVTNHGDKLQSKMYTHQVDHVHSFYLNGLNPLMDIAHLKFCDSLPKPSQTSSMWAHILLFPTWRTIPSMLLFSTCHCNSCDMVGEWYICFSHAIRGKCCKILMGIVVHPTCLYFSFPHFW